MACSVGRLATIIQTKVRSAIGIRGDPLPKSEGVPLEGAFDHRQRHEALRQREFVITGADERKAMVLKGRVGSLHHRRVRVPQNGDLEVESCPCCLRGCESNVSSMGLDDALGNRKSQTGSRRTGYAGDSEKLLKNSIAKFIRDSGTSIVHNKRYHRRIFVALGRK
jgi:hypothetical protein